MGVAGAALSTLFSRALSAIVIFYYLRKPRQVVVVKDYLQIRPDMPLIMKILAIGVPAGIENGMFQFGKLAIQSTVSTMGTVAIAAQAMANILEMVNGIFGVGVGIGLMTMVGQAIGAGRREEAKFYVVRCTQIGLVGILVSCLLVLAAAKPILWIAGMEAESAAMCFDMVVAITIAKPLFWTFSFIPAYGMRRGGGCKIFHDNIYNNHVVFKSCPLYIFSKTVSYGTDGGLVRYVRRLGGKRCNFLYSF